MVSGDRIANSLRDKAKNWGIRTDRMQQLYVKERLLYRLNEVFPTLMLKGGTVDYIRSPATARFSPDLDFHLPERPEDFDLLIEDTLSRTFYDDNGVVEDGVDVRAVRCQELRAFDEPGLKFKLECALGNTRVNVKMDFAFGGSDPDPVEVRTYPSIYRSLPEFRVRTQPVAYKLADKLHAMIEHGFENTRVKDFWDIAWHLDRGTVTVADLARAVAQTFRDRGTVIEATPAGLTVAYALANETAWTKWHADNDLSQEHRLVEVVEAIRPTVTQALVRAIRMQAPPESHLRLVPAA